MRKFLKYQKTFNKNPKNKFQKRNNHCIFTVNPPLWHRKFHFIPFCVFRKEEKSINSLNMENSTVFPTKKKSTNVNEIEYGINFIWFFFSRICYVKIEIDLIDGKSLKWFFFNNINVIWMDFKSISFNEKTVFHVRKCFLGKFFGLYEIGDFIRFFGDQFGLSIYEFLALNTLVSTHFNYT